MKKSCHNSKINKGYCKCGSNEFFVREEIIHEGVVDEDGILCAILYDHHIKEILCTKCKEKKKIEDFNDIDFN